MIDFNYTILIQFFNFLILLILLNFLLFKPVLRMINKREKTVSSLFEKVQSETEGAQKLKKSYEDDMSEGHKKILDHRNTTLAEATQLSLQRIEEARVKYSGKLSKKRNELDKQSREIADALKKDVERLSTELAQTILKRSL